MFKNSLKLAKFIFGEIFAHLVLKTEIKIVIPEFTTINIQRSRL